MTALGKRLIHWIVAGLSVAFLNRVYVRDWATATVLGTLLFIGGVLWFALSGSDEE